MGIDSTIALGVKPPQIAAFNPLASLDDMAKTGNALVGYRQGQQQLAARQAIGQAYQAAANPDGSVDYAKLQNNIEQNPAAAWMAPQVMQGIQEQQKRAFDLQKAGQDQATSRAGIFSSALAPLLAKGNDIGTSDVTGVLARLHAAGIPIDGAVQQVIQTMPTGGGAPLRQWALQNFGAGLPASDQVSTFLPKVATQDTGGQVSTYDSNPVTNPGATSQTFNKTLTPGEQVAPQTGVTPGGVSYSQTTAARANQSGLGNLVPGQGQGSGQGSPFGTGRILLPGGSAPAAGSANGGSDFGTASGDPAGGTGAPGNGLPAGAVPTSLTPAASAAATAAGTSSAADLHDMYASANVAPSQLYQLQKAQSSLQTAGATGPGTETTQAIASFLNTQVPFGLGKYLPGVDPTQIQSYDEAAKYLKQFASNSAAASGSDSRLATALSSNASTHINSLAAQDVVTAAIGMTKMQQAKAAAWSASGQTPDQYDQFNTQWSQNADPRAYIFDALSPQQRTTVLSSIPDNQKSGFLDQVWNAGQAGLLDPSKLYAQPAAGGQSASSASAPSAPVAAAIPTATAAATASTAPPSGVLPPMVPTGY